MKTMNMKMRKGLVLGTLVVTGVLILVHASLVSATTIGFEDILAPGQYRATFTNPYDGFTFAGTQKVLAHDYLVTETGIIHGTVGNASWLSGSTGVSFSSLNAQTFNFIGAYITPIFNNNQPITVQGWLNGSVVYTQTVTSSWSAGTFWTFDFAHVDKVSITPDAGGTLDPAFSPWSAKFDGTRYLVVDNITYVTNPEPASILLMTSGLVGLGLWRALRSRKG